MSARGTRRIRATAGRAVTIAGLAAVMLMTTGEPVLADPARPTNYRSELTSVDPAGVDVRIIGGDAFLGITVDPGVEVVVLGYGGEPYVRIDPVGDVWVNTRSPAFYLNDDRYAQTEVPPAASVDAEPEWVIQTSGGTYGWHDHRIHWMAPQPPPGIQRDAVSEIMQWTVPMEVDGRPVAVSGTLLWLPSQSPVPWIGLGVAALGGMLFAHRKSIHGRSVIAILGGAAAVLIGAAETLASPLGAAEELVALGPPFVALVLGILSLLHRRASMPLAVAAVLLAMWSLMRIATLWMPQLPTDLPIALERSAVAIALGAAVALTLVTVRSVLQPVELESK